MRRYYWAEYDFDGSFDFYETATNDPPSHYGNLLGPFETYSESKREVIRAFRNCIDGLKDGIAGAKQHRKAKGISA